MFKQGLCLVIALALVSCTNPVRLSVNPWPAWDEAISEANAAYERLIAVERVAGSTLVIQPTSKARAADIQALASSARLRLSVAVPPAGGEAFRDQLVQLFARREALAARVKAHEWAADPFSCVARPTAGCVANRQFESEIEGTEAAWRRDFQDVRARYSAWLATQGR